MYLPNNANNNQLCVWHKRIWYNKYEYNIINQYNVQNSKNVSNVKMRLIMKFKHLLTVREDFCYSEELLNFWLAESSPQDFFGAP